MGKLLPPVSYQGAKVRIAPDIVDKIDLSAVNFFADVCCGTGSVSLEMVNRGFDPLYVTMIDAGPWGIFWNEIGEGKFDIDKLREYCNQVPKDLNLVKDYLLELSKQPAHIDTTQVFLLLQSGSFGGKAIWIKDNKWKNTSFRSYWQPTDTSNRRSPVTPMHPYPEEIVKRTEIVMEKMLGVRGYCTDAYKVALTCDTVVYVDPPYKGTTQYGHDFDLEDYIDIIPCDVYCSEGKPVSSISWLISEGRKKGGISGNRSEANQEWLSKIDADCHREI